ncbi:hypothetical protein B0H16DRAFT_1698249 [Mycena metata]|uniref:Uncharacterized protein n=1 Tax=Mycena metata TaxID=1033252 RepID=A0AAD7DYI2_9AGAR|nr:hypothetical protein B0H16DRAFT_1705533 [Mycena metata]KAJ7725812.1 hypothetical protein B0H16DRAFT_1698249 [Mycena metata]
MNEAHEDEESSSNRNDAHEEDEERSFCDSDWQESGIEGNGGKINGELEACTQQHDAPREVHQEPTDRNSSSMDQETHKGSQNPYEGATGGGFISRFFWRLQQGLVTETDDVDTDPISPFLV